MQIVVTGTDKIKKTSVLITGGSGLVGRYLTSLLLSQNFRVSHLSTQSAQFGMVRVYRWDPSKAILDPSHLEDVDYIVHLAGANIGEKRWTTARKREITDSRIVSARLLHKTITENGISLKAFISASATGYYGSATSGHLFSEDDPPATDFLGRTCRLWEESASLFEKSGIRSVMVRTGVVLEKNSGALAKLSAASGTGFMVTPGNGRQFIPWIHISDLCKIYLKAITDSSMSGPYNAVAPQHISLHDFMKILSEVIHKPLLPIHIPGFLIRAALGEMSDVILKGSRVSPSKLISSGFMFDHASLREALEDLMSKNG